MEATSPSLPQTLTATCVGSWVAARLSPLQGPTWVGGSMGIRDQRRQSLLDHRAGDTTLEPRTCLLRKPSIWAVNFGPQGQGSLTVP